MSTASQPSLDPDLATRVLEKLGFSRRPVADLAGLHEFYAAWCQCVPFDNVTKLISLKSDGRGLLPGSTPAGFFECWLAHGTGGTCWSGAGALYAILETLGFEVERVLATMLVAPDVPPSHGSVLVRMGEDKFLLDTSLLHHEPLLLVEDRETCIDHPAWGVNALRRDARWHITWRPLHKPAGLECRLEGFGLSSGDFQDRYDNTRGWSPFNYQVCARRNIGDEVIGLAFGNYVNLRPDGSVVTTKVTDEERQRTLIDLFGMSEEIVNQLPADRPTPPPPGSKKAAEMERDSRISGRP